MFDRVSIAMALGLVNANVVPVETEDACLEAPLADVLLRYDVETAPAVHDLVDKRSFIVEYKHV
jgi:hypothetical protein